ncbi:hypothetical protein THAOC_09135, partial [Thalassiosira oceanica]
MSGAGRRLGSKSSFKSTRNQTPAEKAAQNEKAQATKQKNRDARAEAERAKNKAYFLNSLAGGGKTNSSEARRNRADESAQQSSRERPPANVDDATQAHSASDSKDTEAGEVQCCTPANTCPCCAPVSRGPLDVSNSNNPASALGSNSVECIRVDNVSARPAIEITHRTISRRNDLHQATNVEANFDFDEEEAKKMGCDDLPDDKGGGVQQDYLEKLVEQLRLELNRGTKNREQQWLLCHLRANDWWIRQVDARRIAKKLRLKQFPKALYRDVYVWLPDVMWPGSSEKSEMMPCCPNCLTNERVAQHCFRDNHFGRLIIGLNTTYYTISRRYICYECQEASKRAKAAYATIAQQVDAHAAIDQIDDSSYTFMAWDNRIMHLYKYGRGARFPAFLTWRAGLDKTLLRMLPPLQDGGFRADRTSKMICELHSLAYDDACIEHEHEIQRLRSNPVAASNVYEPLGDFNDPRTWRGKIPTANYLVHARKLFFASIKAHLDKSVKQRGAEVLHWDVSYKEAKHLCRYRGKSIFKGLVTATNELGEVRIQFHVYTDSHEQMKSALDAFKKTTASLGLPAVRLFFTDNPKADQKFYQSQLPSLARQQMEFDEQCPQEESPAALPEYDFKSLCVRVVDSSNTNSRRDANDVVNALLEVVKDKRIGLDAEWEIRKEGGRRAGRGKINTIQIGYRNLSGKVNVLIFRTEKWTSLPNRLETLLLDNSITIAGNKVSGDLKYIGDDFNVQGIASVDQKSRPNVVNLAKLAKQRGIVADARAVGLKLLAEVLLKVRLDKSLQTCGFSGAQLTEDELKYVAIDGAVSLECLEELINMPDIYRYLEMQDILVGKKLDIVPMRGDTYRRGAVATVVDQLPVECPANIIPSHGSGSFVRAGDGCCVVQVESIYSPALVIPGYATADRKGRATLKDLGCSRIVIPIAYLREHNSFYKPPLSSGNEMDAAGVTQPTAAHVQEARVTQPTPTDIEEAGVNQPTHTDVEEAGVTQSIPADVEEDLNNGDDEVTDYNGYVSQFDDVMSGLDSSDIKLLEAAIFQTEEASVGQSFLHCPELGECLAPDRIQNRFSSVLGDIYHAMSRTKVPVKHEAKKAYFAALKNAFLIWNPRKLDQLKTSMRAQGKSDEEIEAMMYYNNRVFQSCVDRPAPASKGAVLQAPRC